MKIPVVWRDSNSIKEKEERERDSCVESREQTLKFRQLDKQGSKVSINSNHNFDFEIFVLLSR